MRGEDVDAADDEHVVGAAHDLAHARGGAPAGARLARERGEVARPVAEHRRALAGERRDDQLAHLPVSHGLAGDRVQALGEKVVLGDVHAAAALALAGHARTRQLGEPVVVGGPDRQPLLDPRSSLLAAGLGAEHAQAQLESRAVHVQLVDSLPEVQRVGRRGDEDGRAVVLHHLELTGRVAGTDGHDRDTGALQAVVQPEPAGEHAVAEGDLGDVARVRADGHREAADELRPGVEVGLRVPADDGLTGSTRRGVDLDHLVERHGEQAVGVVVAEVVLLGEGQPAEVGEAGEVAGREARGVEGRTVERDLVVQAGEQAAQALQLQILQTLAVHCLVLRVPDGHRLLTWSLPVREQS